MGFPLWLIGILSSRCSAERSLTENKQMWKIAFGIVSHKFNYLIFRGLEAKVCRLWVLWYEVFQLFSFVCLLLPSAVWCRSIIHDNNRKKSPWCKCEEQFTNKDNWIFPTVTNIHPTVTNIHFCTRIRFSFEFIPHWSSRF